MALKPDQRAMLQLLLERDQSYDDLASVLGVEPDEVHERARAALTELGGSDPDAEVGLTDYLLGQADPIGRADAVRHLQSDPEAQALAQKIAAQLQLLAPDADLPQLPGGKAKRAKRPADADEPRDSAATAPRAIPGSAGAGALAASARTRWDEHRKQSAIILAAVAAVLIVGVLLLTGVIGGGDDGSSDSSTQLLGYPLAPLQVDKQGNVQGELPMEQLGLTILSRSADVDVSLTSNDSLSPAIQAALQQGQPVIDYQGTTVLRGALDDAKTSNSGLALDLQPEDGDASGKIAILAKDKKPVMDLDIRGLDQPPANQSYVLWAVLPEGTELPAPASANSTAPGAAPPATGAPPATAPRLRRRSTLPGAAPPAGGTLPPATGGGGGGGGGGQ